MNFVEAQRISLVALYMLLRESDKEEYFSAESIKLRAGVQVGAAFMQRALRVLLEDDLVVSNPRSSSMFSLTGNGFDAAEKIIEESPGIVPMSIPASDRIVSLGHNRPEYDEVEVGLTELVSQVSAWNGNPDLPEERDRLLRTLEAAQTLWRSNELRLIQIKVGILMAVEDAQRAIGVVAKAVGGKLLIDAIKGLIKNHSGVDLDHI